MVPIYLAEQCVRLGRSCRIVITQPRRLAAKGLAKRVSDQAGTQVGQVAGYRVGNDKNDMGAPIVYVTVGHLLEALVHNPSHLDSFSHIVLDEVHERFVEADFLMALLRMMLSRPQTTAVRVVVMSATLQRTLGRFFAPLLLPSPGSCTAPGQLSLPGATPYEVQDFMWEDIRKEFPNAFSVGTSKEPNFMDLRPSKIKLLRNKIKSDRLTKLCKDLAPFCAGLLCQLAVTGRRIALVFCPGLDKMREVEKALEEEARRRQLPIGKPKIYLVHSALEEETYRDALQPAPEGEWRVALSTNIAESSLTVPGVSAVVDFGLHRVNIYDDEVRMSMLCTTWCSKASMKQRRGRTGRTNPGVYIRMLPSAVVEELADFDESGVERSPLTRVTLEAAHLAQLLSSPPIVRAGFPVDVQGGGRGAAAFWDGPRGGWRVTPGSANDAPSATGGKGQTYPEASLTPLRLEATHVLSLLPAPPHETRVHHALLELREYGALTPEDTPTVLGCACLKVPLDVPFARLVVIGWALGSAAEAAVLGAALSLAPTCDVIRTPFNTKCELYPDDLKHLTKAIHHRRKHDGGSFSEPITVYNLFMRWLEKEGGYLGRMPWVVDFKDSLHPRMWPQFTVKVVDIWTALLRILPSASPETQQIQELIKRARHGTGTFRQPPAAPERLAALLTWGLAPGGFVAVGQTPALYSGGAVEVFEEVVREHNGTMAGTLEWPSLRTHEAQAIMRAVTGVQAAWTAGAHGNDDNCFLGVDRTDGDQLPEGSEVLFRLCGPFNGKETWLTTMGREQTAAKPPRHPCTLNWYMPRRDGHGVLEVRVDWRSQAETLLHIPRPGDRGARARPKQLLVAAGGEWRSGGKVILRGVTLLPSQDGGRGALLWLLAAGLPREGRLVALAAPAPHPDLESGDFEIRAIRLWRRTLCLRDGESLTGGDLLAVNAFRSTLMELTRRRPHRLAGTWCCQGGGSTYIVECLGASAARSLCEGHDVLAVRPAAGGPAMRLCGQRGAACWRLLQDAGCGSEAEVEVGRAEEAAGGAQLRWADGSRWALHERQGGEGAPLLAQVGADAVRAFRDAAEALLEASADAGAPGGGGRGGNAAHPVFGEQRGFLRQKWRWPTRLVPLEVQRLGLVEGSAHLAPFNIGRVESMVAKFAAQLREEDAEAEEEELADVDFDGDDASFDVSQEGVNEEFMWRLAKAEQCTPAESRSLCFVESAIALPRTAICVKCEEEGKTFSKSQLRRHPDDRVCQDCVEKEKSSIYKPAGACRSVAPQAHGASRDRAAVVRAAALPALAGHCPTQVAICSMCHVQLTAQNCSTSQRSKAPSKRRCNECVGSQATAARA